MGFWDKLEKWANNVEESATKFEKKANDFLDKHFPEEEKERPTYTASMLLSLLKKKARRITEAQLLAGLQSLENTTSTLVPSSLGEDDDIYDGLHIATATIEQSINRHPKLSDVQYTVKLKGLVEGTDDYHAKSVYGKYEIEFTIDEYSDYVFSVKVMSRW